MKVLFIGNSYTFYNDMPTMFENLANANQSLVTVRSITKGGRRLESYSDSNDEITIALDRLLKEEKFDVCFVQEQSVLPASDLERFLSGVDCVMEKVGDRAQRFIFYATWGRKKGSTKLSEHGWTPEIMTSLLSDAYHQAAEKYAADLSPVGTHFLNVTKNYPEIDLYNKDLSHPSYFGSCLAALTHYHTVFGEFPENTSSLELPPEILAVFRSEICG